MRAYELMVIFESGLDDLGITEGATVTVGGECAPRGTTTTT